MPSQPFAATLFVDWSTGVEGLGELIAKIVGGQYDGLVVQAERLDAIVGDNDDYDATQALEWPDGFVHFQAVVEFHVEPDVDEAGRAELLGHLLSQLWARGIPAVAASLNEEMLPAGGGTADRSLPWPTRDVAR